MTAPTLAPGNSIQRAADGVVWPAREIGESWYEYHAQGATESWIAQLASSLLGASGGHSVLETGSYMGTTTAWLAKTLARMGGGTLVAAEIDPVRAASATALLEQLGLPESVAWTVDNRDVFDVIAGTPNRSLDFVWLDDDHTLPHVRSEIGALWPKMKDGGIIAGHDVFGSCDLRQVFKAFNGLSLDLPRIGPAGGVGIIQVGR